MGEVSAAFVGDTAVFGPTSPILGGRQGASVRLEDYCSPSAVSSVTPMMFCVTGAS
jgi:hypothetical protein